MLDQYIAQLSQVSFAGNTAWEYTYAILIFMATIIGLKLVQMIVLARLNVLAKRTDNDFDDTLIKVFKHVRPPFYLMVALYIAFQQIYVPDTASLVVRILFIAVLVYEVVGALGNLVDFGVQTYADRARATGDKGRVENQAMVRAVQIILKIFLWVLGILVILGNLGVNVTSLIAGLGVGGLAVALALQNILSDIFSSFSIYFDKPFEIGDTIKVGEVTGKVEKIGLKTTRLRSLMGEEVIMSNRNLTNASIKNYGRMEHRNVKFHIGVEYGTETKKLKKIPKIMEKVITKVDHLEFTRCNFDEFGDSAIIFEIVYKVDDSNFSLHATAREEVYFGVYSAFEKEGIAFAYPTQVTINRTEKN